MSTKRSVRGRRLYPVCLFDRRVPLARVRQILFEALEDRRVLANWFGDIPDGTVWTSSEVQRIVGDVRIPAGATLRIQPGTQVKFDAFAGFDMFVEGRLLAGGTSSLPIIITSMRDDSGLDGILGNADDIDSNGNGPSNGSNGDWNAIHFPTGGTGSTLDNVQVRFGGAGTAGSLVAHVPISLTNSLIRNSSSAGVRLQTSNATLTANAYQNNSGAAISMDLASNPTITGVVATNNYINGLTLDSGVLVGNGFWDDPDIVYRTSGDITVPSGRTLTVAPGQIVKFRTFASDDLKVDGTLIADGTPTQRIIFTSERDDTRGGDTNGNGASTASRGDWDAIILGAGSSGHVLDNVEIHFGGSGNVQAALVAKANMRMSNSLIASSGGNALRIEKNQSAITSNRFADNNGAAISMDLASNPAIVGVSISNNGVNGLNLDAGNLVGNGLWDDPDIVYRTTGDITVPAGQSLTITAGQIIKFRTFASDDLLISGSLHAQGANGLPVIFTSERDDTAGGDTNNNGVSVASNGDWNSIALLASSMDNSIATVGPPTWGRWLPPAVQQFPTPWSRGQRPRAFASKRVRRLFPGRSLGVPPCPVSNAGISSTRASTVPNYWDADTIGTQALCLYASNGPRS